MRNHVECMATILAVIIIAAGCAPKYTWDETAQRCRDTVSGQWVEDVKCGR